MIQIHINQGRSTCWWTIPDLCAMSPQVWPLSHIEECKADGKKFVEELAIRIANAEKKEAK